MVGTKTRGAHCGRKVPAGDHLGDPTRRNPLQRDRGGDSSGSTSSSFFDPLIRLGELDPKSIGTASEQGNLGVIFGHVARLHVAVDQRCLVVVDPDPDRVLGVDDDLISACFQREQRAFPVDREDVALVELLVLGVGGVDAEIEVDLGIDSFDDLRLPATSPAVGILRLQASLVSPWGRGGAEAADQVGNRVLILADGQAGQLDSGRGIGAWAILE